MTSSWLRTNIYSTPCERLQRRKASKSARSTRRSEIEIETAEDRKPKTEARTTEGVVEFNAVSHTYPVNRPALHDVTFRVNVGERVGLIGPSGAGKSTILRAINGLIVPTAGQVWTLEQEVDTLSERGRMRLRRRIGMIFQEFALIERLPVLTNVLVGRLGYVRTLPSLFRLFPPTDMANARHALQEVGLSEYEERMVRHLSGGQKQRVGIARALAQEASLILGDEPTANLDVRTADEILTLLVRLGEERGATLILSLHDVRAARRFCTRILALRDGRLAWDGPATSFGDAEMERIFYDATEPESE